MASVGSSERPAAKEPGVAAFRKLGRLIARRSRVIALLWLVVVLISAPAALRVGEIQSSGSGGFDIPDAESVRASEILDEQFPRAFANSTAIIVIRAGDVGDAGTRDFVVGLEERLTTEGAQPNLSSFASAYSVERIALTEAVLQLAPLLAGVNATAAVVWGLPEEFVAAWNATSPNLTVAERDEAANATLSALVSARAASDPGRYALAPLYFPHFYAAWTATAGNATLVSDPDLRATLAVAAAVPGFAAVLPDPQAAALVFGVSAAFPLHGWSAPALRYAFVNAQAAAFQLPPLPSAFLSDIEGLGLSPSRAEAAGLANATIRAGTLSTYPVALPPDALRAFSAPDNRTMILIVGYDRAPVGFGSVGNDPVLLNVRKIRENVTELKQAAGAPQEVYVTGNAATSLDSAESGQRDFERIEPATVSAIFLLVSLFFLAAFVVFIPLGSIFIALFITQAVVYVIGKYVVHVPDTTLTFLFTIVLGVGIDYAVFLMARYREERAAGATREEAVETAVTWAGESITTSGATVMIAFAILALGSFEFLQAMGYAVGVGVAVALAVSLTLIPALLRIIGNRMFWPTSGARLDRRLERARQRKAGGHETYFRRAAQFSVNHARAVVLVAALVSIPTTYISLTGHTSFDFIAGLPDTESSRGLDAMQEGFGAGQLGPTIIVVVFPDDIASNSTFSPEAHEALDGLSTRILALPNIASVSGPTRANGTHRDPGDFNNLTPAERASLGPSVGRDNRTALLTVIFTEEPFTRASMQSVRDIRAAVQDAKAADPALAAAAVYVGGQTALSLDFANTMDDQFLQMRILVVVAIYIILLLVLGSYLLPLSAVLSVTLSITWAFAATLFFFNNVLGAEVLFIVPLILFIMLMGIGMDYNIFILTRIREESEKGKGPKEAAVDAVEATGGIITALALILAAALGSLMLSDNTMLKGFGFAIAFAVLLDAMVVRTYLVPAVMALLGEKAWVGPKRLRRVQPAAERAGPPKAPDAK